MAAFVGECAFDVGDCVITIGTGSFISINVGHKPIASMHGAYPLPGFVCKNNKIYVLHTAVSSAGLAIDWAKQIGLYNEYNEIEDILKSCESSNGVFFVPAFGFLQNDGIDKSSIGTGFIGLKQTTTKREILRSIFDSIAFSIKNSMQNLIKDLKMHRIILKSVRVNGGVTKSDFLCQYLSNLLDFPVEKSNFSYNASAVGAAFTAGLSNGLYTKLRDLDSLRTCKRVFQPNHEEILRKNHYETELAQWSKTVERFMDWN